MDPRLVIRYFGTQVATAQALGLKSHATVNHWLKMNRIPAARQAQIEEITGGKLRAGVKPWEAPSRAVQEPTPTGGTGSEEISTPDASGQPQT